jgi:hypothetical protein
MRKQTIIAAIKRKTGHTIEMFNCEGAWVFARPLEMDIHEEHVVDRFHSQMVHVYALDHLPLDRWVEEFEGKVEEAEQSSYSD